MKILFAAAAAMLILASLAPLPAAAASCPKIAKFTGTSYNQTPLWGVNQLSWSALGASRSQVWVVERSDDSGASWVEVQRSTSTMYRTGYVDPIAVRFRVYSTTSAGAPCAPDGAAVVYDPPVLGIASNISP